MKVFAVIKSSKGLFDSDVSLYYNFRTPGFHVFCEDYCDQLTTKEHLADEVRARYEGTVKKTFTVMPE
jgi:hypothetical protein